jgi:serine/threonine-protein kinase
VGTTGIVTRLTARAERARATVPALVGTDRASALLVARSLDLRPRVVQAYSSLAPRGVITAQRPRPGESVDVGSGITLTISLGPQPVAVADVRGLTQATAVSRLQAEGFWVAITHSDSISTPSGTVLDQSVTPGVRRVPGSQITLEISRKPWWWIF